MTQAVNEAAVWCGNAYQDEVPPALATTPHCNTVGTVLVIDPEGGWSGTYCETCAQVLVAAGWVLPEA